MDKNHCWTALNYTKLLQLRTTPALKDNEKNLAVSMKAKEALIRKSAFPKPLPNFLETSTIPLGLAYTKITKDTMGQTLLTQAATKGPRLDKINFQVLQIIWS